MTNDQQWLAAAFTTDALVAELLLRLKRSSSSDSSSPSTAPAPLSLNLNPPRWGDRKSRSKPAAFLTVGKGQQQRSPSTPLSWIDGGDLSTSDGYDESSRPSDLYAGVRSAKIDLHQSPKKECETEPEVEMMKRRRCMLPDLNETPVFE